jgi:hypothetical protein
MASRVDEPDGGFVRSAKIDDGPDVLVAALWRRLGCRLRPVACLNRSVSPARFPRYGSSPVTPDSTVFSGASPKGRGWLVVSEVSSPGDAGGAAALVLAIQEFVANGRRSGRQRQSAASPERAAVAVSVGVALAFQSDSLVRLQQPAGWFRPRCCDCFASPDSASIALYGRFGVTSSCCASGIARIRSRARDRGR